MPIDLGTLFLTALAYLGLLFLVAWLTERGAIPARVVRHPAVLSLSLGVYATTWTYYGSVGFAARSGFLFLTVYLGATLAFLAAPVMLAPVLRVVRDRELQSLADLLAFRYANRFTGPLVTVFMLVGLLPYMALQIRAVISSIEVLTGQHARVSSPIMAAAFCAVISLFAMAFGARHLKPRARHEGLVVAIAFESMVKLVALLVAGVFVLVTIFGGWSGIGRWLAENPHTLPAMYAPVGGGTWVTLLLLSACAAFVLPRCFHMLFCENNSPGGLRTASWLYPMYLLLLNLPIPLILWAGIKAESPTPPDYFVLSLAQHYGNHALTLLTYVGGISAASGMLIVESLALGGMCLNHLMLPLALRRMREGDLYRQLRSWRRVLLVSVVGLGYLAYVVMRQNQGLVQMGMISFLAVTQFVPGVAALLWWPRVTGSGFVTGVCGGMTVWFVSLMLPLLGVRLWFVPQAATIDWPLLTFWSLATNVGLLAVVSLATRPGVRELLADQTIR
ncbi:MAG: histidine kinase, partial [Gallionella sp.]|nr:histidine kinase [Gallionella sp.]